MNQQSSSGKEAFNTESRISAVDTAGALTYSASSAGVDSLSDIGGGTESESQKSSSNRFVDIIGDDIEIRQPKIESKDHMWRPAPIVGRDFSQRAGDPEIVTTSSNKPTITSQLRKDTL